MSLYQLPTEHRPPRRGFWRTHAWWLIPLLVFDAVFLFWWFGGRDESPDPAPAAEAPAGIDNPAPPPEPEGIVLTFPAVRENPLAMAPEDLYMPTGSGRIESAYYGSVRTAKVGSSYLPSFHEGIDIGPTARDRKQRPLDEILAAADGRVLYVNKVGGRSNYGKYIVLGHDDPVGEIYTLYAHLGDVASGLEAGREVRAGEVIGIMGNTASTGLPMVRAHLHFEIGMIVNSRFYGWFKQQKMKPDHKAYHGYNLIGINPQEALLRQEDKGRFSMKEYLASLQPAFTLVFRTNARPDYFDRYPSLWQGEDPYGGAVVVTVSEGGAVLSGRAAGAEEIERLGSGRDAVLSADREVLGRNGLRLVVERNGRWELGRNGLRWLEILAYR